MLVGLMNEMLGQQWCFTPVLGRGF